VEIPFEHVRRCSLRGKACTEDLCVDITSECDGGFGSRELESRVGYATTDRVIRLSPICQYPWPIFGLVGAFGKEKAWNVHTLVDQRGEAEMVVD
jgi:hypothetical protein